MRKTTNQLLDMCQTGVLTWQQVAEACLGFMSEYQVSDMASCEGFIEDEEEFDEDEDPEFDIDEIEMSDEDIY